MALRQAVLVAAELAPVVSELRAQLGLGEPYADPGVAHFGLANAVMALGDTFLEVVAPLREDAAAARHLARRGPGGYMLLFDVADLDGARERARAAGVRAVWEADLPDIAATHLHPADLRGAIVSIDRPVPPGSWRWGGPAWTGRAATGAPGRVCGATVAAGDPEAVAARWAHVLGVEAHGATALVLDGSTLTFVESAQEGVVEVALELPDDVRGGREAVEVGGLRLRLGACGAQPPATSRRRNASHAAASDGTA